MIPPDLRPVRAARPGGRQVAGLDRQARARQQRQALVAVEAGPDRVLFVRGPHLLLAEAADVIARHKRDVRALRRHSRQLLNGPPRRGKRHRIQYPAGGEEVEPARGRRQDLRVAVTSPLRMPRV